MLRVLATVGLATLAGCTGDGVVAGGPAQPTSASPAAPPSTDIESPNSLPNGSTTQNPMASQTGVVGVTHLPP